ncbi:MAG TPA: radical SAM protein [Micromonosporaceae bacterium]|nr:radical SAM protein [Micromonosporaceae bacterium]
MRVELVVCQPDMPSDFCQQPLETLYAATLLEGCGHDVGVIDLRVADLPENRLGQADVMFLVTQTYDLTQCYSISLSGSRRTVADLRRRAPGVPLVAVGVHASLEPEMTARDLGCDAALPGELESAVPWLVAQLGEDPLAYRGDLSRAPRAADLGSLPVPNLGLVDVDRYYGEVVAPGHRSILRGTTGLVFANRGCPYSCAYCFVWFGSRMRWREPGQVAAELAAQVRAGVRDFFFLDYTFTLRRSWVVDLCERIADSGLDISWICQTRCEKVDPDLLAVMRAAGCRGVFYGVESPWIAETDMLKPTPRGVIERAISDTVEAGILPMVFVLVGLENEDPAKARELQAWLAGLPAVFDVSTLLPRPFTTLWERYTAGLPRPRSWDGYQALADTIRDRHFTPPALREVQQAITALPNYAGNAVAVAGRA